jgi:hypothetical protein
MMVKNLNFSRSFVSGMLQVDSRSKNEADHVLMRVLNVDSTAPLR